MKQVTLHYAESAGFSQNDMILAAQPLSDEVKRMSMASEKGYEDLRASINLPVDSAYQKKILQLADSFGKVDLVVVAGIGGSNLGAKAIYEAALDSMPEKGPKMLFADTVDPDSTAAIIARMKEILKSRKKVVLCFITKSGGTTETIANFEALYEAYRKEHKQAAKHVVAITDKDSRLWHLAETEGFHHIPIPEKVGGRYSVFSAVGMFPLALAGIDTRRLLAGASQMRKRCLAPELLENPAAVSATWLYLNFRKGRTIHDTFLFANSLESAGKWYRQLMGESIGKQHDIHHRTVWRGMTPTVSVGSTDLHSMAQLYLGGPYDKCTTFVTLNEFQNTLSVPRMDAYEELVPHIQGKPFNDIMTAIQDGVKTAFLKGKRSFVEISLPDKSEESLGQLLQLKMFEMMYLGFLLNVNPFDQPNVESYKAETKEILSRSATKSSSPAKRAAPKRKSAPKKSATKKAASKKKVVKAVAKKKKAAKKAPKKKSSKKKTAKTVKRKKSAGKKKGQRRR